MNDPLPVLLLGGGGHAAVVADALRASGREVAGFLDDDQAAASEGERIGLRWLGTVEELARVSASLRGSVTAHAAVGDARLRRRWADAVEALGLRLARIVHPSACVSTSAELAEGVFVGPLSIVNARVAIGRSAIINSGAIVEHDVVIGRFAHVAPGSVVAGGATIGESSLLGCGAVVLPGVSIGPGATLGAGGVATADVPAGSTAAGSPARVLIAQERA